MQKRKKKPFPKDDIDTGSSTTFYCTKRPKHADGLVHIYKQEAQDIDRFAAFAKTLKPQ